MRTCYFCGYLIGNTGGTKLIINDVIKRVHICCAESRALNRKFINELCNANS